MEKYAKLLLIGISTLGIWACTPTVQVAAPEKPIEINLNVNIEHKVRVQIDKDINNLLEDSNGLF